MTVRPCPANLSGLHVFHQGPKGTAPRCRCGWTKAALLAEAVAPMTTSTDLKHCDYCQRIRCWGLLSGCHCHCTSPGWGAWR